MSDKSEIFECTCYDVGHILKIEYCVEKELKGEIIGDFIIEHVFEKSDGIWNRIRHCFFYLFRYRDIWLTPTIIQRKDIPRLVKIIKNYQKEIKK